MPTRRQVLVGLAALAAATATGVGFELGRTRRQRILHALGLANSPDRGVRPSGTPLVSGHLASRHMPRPVSWTISAPARPTGVVYCLHGKSEDHRFAFDVIHLHDFVAAAGAGLAIAAVDGDPDSYWHRRVDGRDPMSMLLEEFIPMVDQRLGTSVRALLGWSTGGYGALLAAETAPEQFRAVAATSPALWTSPGATAPGAFDSPGDFAAHNVFTNSSRLAALTVRVDCGTGDPFYRATKVFVGGLPSRPQSSFGPGFHDAAYWRSVAPAQVSTLETALLANR